MTPDLSTPAGWLPIAFMALMGLSMLAYVILDGYDLGVGILLRRANDADKDTMIASISPFWDANETWLVLGIGILLVAFPLAHGVILTALYLPVALMLFGLILRGVAFDFRVKAHAHHKPWWNRAFYAGSLLATLAQGGMLGFYIVGFEWRWESAMFALFTAFALASGYALLGATWLIMKTEGALQTLAVSWARKSVWLTAAGVAAISIATPIVSPEIFAKWFSFPNAFLLAPIPLMTAALFVVIHRSLAHMPAAQDKWCWVPFACTVGIFILAFHGLAYSLFPYLVVQRITIWQAASAPESLMIMFIGICFVLPIIIAYTIFAYRVFWGKAKALSYY
ncbi:cytochrome d ubiquinol oxidase subunit II [Chitinimonas sp. PSY-7]|uniref:cytochrome d ubiquinol oxidase subunit II n=1 Tax=Chitinimonas sp. PSY-7 TaxID=3459088 RepID=UPI0040400434